MLIFRRIFNFEKEKVAQIEQRLNHRYLPGADFPLQAVLRLDRHDHRGVVQNISGGGVGLLVARETAVNAEQSIRVHFQLDRRQLDLPARLIRAEPAAEGIYCGLGLDLADFMRHKAFLQLLQPIVIGQTLQRVAPERVIQNEPQFIKQIYRGEFNSVLTVWRAMTPGSPIHSFEFRMHDYFCRARTEARVLEAYTLESAESHKGKLTNPVFDATGGLQDEIRQLFRWIVPNLSPAVPDDVRALLGDFAATR